MKKSRLLGAVCALVLTFGLVAPVSAVLLYGIDVTGMKLVTVDSNSGTSNVVGNLGISNGGGGLDFDSTGNLIAVLSNSLYSINLSTGAASLLGATGVMDSLESFTILDGKGYSQGTTTGTLYEVNLSTGATAAIGGSIAGIVSSLTNDGTNLFGARVSAKDLVQINATTGLIDSTIGAHGVDTVTSLAYGEGQFWTIPALSQNLYSLDSINAAATLELSGLSVSHITSLTAAPVPIPAAVWLFGSGLLGLIGIAKRKKAA